MNDVTIPSAEGYSPYNNPRFQDLTGRVYSRLTVIRWSHRIAKNSTNVTHFWMCQCSCGSPAKPVATSALRTGRTVSCGCNKREKATRHGFCTNDAVKAAGPSPHKAWAGMKGRCLNPKAKGYKNYGGRGIKICEKWIEFEGFYEDMGPTYEKGLKLDRRDNNGDYTKENCQWVTHKQNCNNTRGNRTVEWRGLTRTIAEWSDATGLEWQTIAGRIEAEWPLDDVFTKPLGRGRTRGTIKYKPNPRIKLFAPPEGITGSWCI